MTETSRNRRIAVVLFNLGGPDRETAVRPFLFNLFRDPAIIGLPDPLRTALAWLIAWRRAPKAVEIYDRIGGGSPLLANTEAQARALAERLGGLGEVRCFIAMRYWHPMADETATEVAAFDPDRIVLLPLYPQFSTTTSASSIKDWERAAKAAGVSAPTVVVCCWPDLDGFVASAASAIRAAWEKASAHGRPRVLLSSHGVPKRVIDRGDPYQWQCERTASAIVKALDMPELDWVACYQSRVGPLEWIGPATEDEVKRAGKDGVPLVVVPIAFVSEHSETLVELDIEYGELAHEAGVPAYERVATVSVDEPFIDALAALVTGAAESDAMICSHEGGRICPARFGRCPHAGSTPA